jgi:formate hydrogenlyase subunit 3/multisubunit Na+/H+ antiporter MnhD subunit
LDFAEDEVERPSFKGKLRRSPITDAREKFFSDNKRRRRMAIGLFVSAIGLALVVATVYFIIKLKSYVFINYSSSPYGGYYLKCVGYLNAILILILNMIYTKVAIFFTNYENHRSQTNYDNSLVTKIL